MLYVVLVSVSLDAASSLDCTSFAVAIVVSSSSPEKDVGATGASAFPVVVVSCSLIVNDVGKGTDFGAGVPHLVQNLSEGFNGCPQDSQNMWVSFSRVLRCDAGDDDASRHVPSAYSEWMSVPTGNAVSNPSPSTTISRTAVVIVSVAPSPTPSPSFLFSSTGIVTINPSLAI